MTDKYDIAVIGSGPGGYASAIRCAQRGASVAVIEKGFIGGTCLNCGCIPSKALLASAHHLISAKNAAGMGIDIPSATPNWPKIQTRKDTIVDNFRKGLASLLQSNHIKIIEGRGVVTAPNKVKIETDCGSIETEAGSIILASGSQPIQIDSIPFDGETILSSKEALSLPEIPESMVIVGGGVIGCEMACVYAAVGTKVTIIEALSHLLPMEDDWVGRIIEREFKKAGIKILTNDKVVLVEKSGGLPKVTLESGFIVEAEKLLVSVGRKPVVDKETIAALNLKMSGLAVAVNKKMETNIPGVFAIGDAVGTTYLAHGAFAEAEVAAANATGGDEKMSDYSLVPRAVYTFPEVASIGKTEQMCKSLGLDISIGRSTFAANGRSAAENETTGEIRVIRDNSTSRIIGVTIVAATATEMVAAARTLIGTNEKITDISFPHPTASETLKEAVEDAFDLSLHNRPKKQNHK